MGVPPGEYVSWIHQVDTRESGRSWWGERPGWIRHLAYWAVAATLVAVSLFDQDPIVADRERSYRGAAAIAILFGVGIVFGAIAILRETNQLPAWRTLSRLAVTLAALIGVLAGILQVLRADIVPRTGELTPRVIVEFLSWNVADAVPALKIPDSFGWTPPATSHDVYAGIATLLVRGFVVFIVLVSIKKLWDRVMTDVPPTKQSRHQFST